MFCDIMLGVAVIRCGRDESLQDYREGLRDLEHHALYQPGMPMMVDLRAWGGAVAGEVVARRVAVLMKFIEPTYSLRVAVLAANAAALSSDIERLHRVGIVAASFESVDAARAWLFSSALHPSQFRSSREAGV